MADKFQIEGTLRYRQGTLENVRVQQAINRETTVNQGSIDFLSVADGVSDQEVSLVTATGKLLFIITDKTITVKLNSTESTAITVNGFIWLEGDFSKVYISNASSETAAVTIGHGAN